MSKHSGFELVGDIIPDADNSRNLGSGSKRFAEIHAIKINNNGLRSYSLPLYGMTPDFLQYSQNVYGSTHLAFQFRPAFNCMLKGVRLPLQYAGSPPDLQFDLYRWNGTSWEKEDTFYLATSECGSNAASQPTFVSRFLGTGYTSARCLSKDELYELRISCATGDGSNYWRLYYDEVSYRDWKGKDCVGFKISTDGGSTWADYADRELSVQVLVGVDA